jgi:CheY-like chemotaxis protein
VDNGHCQILVVDDDGDTRTAIQKVLSLAGHTVYAAATLAEGLSHLDGRDCLLLDVNLPDGRGTTILETVRSANRPVAVGICTAYDDPPLRNEVQRFAADAYFTKPVVVEQIVEWVRSVAGKRAESVQSATLPLTDGH